MKSFDITDPYIIPQYNKVLHVLYKSAKKCAVAYQSNWYIVIACTDADILSVIISRLRKLDVWTMDILTGKKKRYYYIKLTFNQKE